MHNEYHRRVNHTDSVPTFFVRIRITVGRCQRIIEYQLGRLEAESMLPLVDKILVVVPFPEQPQTSKNSNDSIVVTIGQVHHLRNTISGNRTPLDNKEKDLQTNGRLS